jgi:hypothetical protein
MATRTTLGLLVPYFGRLPPYFDLWLESCRHNPGVGWTVLTDRHVDLDVPPNVRIHRTSFGAVADRVAEVLGGAPGLTHPYKLCDVKPTYGDVFGDYLAGYDFWGYCDLDVVFGDVRRFVTEEILADADKVYAGGHLSFIRNEPGLNTLYRRGAEVGMLDYREVVATPRALAFDEWGPQRNGLNAIFSAHGRKVHLAEMPYADVKTRHYALRTNREGFTLEPETAASERRKRHIMYAFDTGRLTQHAIDTDTGEPVEREEAYIHLQKRPMSRDQGLGTSPQRFVVLPPNRLAPHPGRIDADYLRRHCRERRIYPHAYVLRWQGLNARVHRAARGGTA